MRVGVVLALLVLVAGCASVPMPTETPGATSTAGSTAEPTATVDPDNPWREAELEVAIRTAADDDRDYAPLVAEAFAYWADGAEQYAGYPVSFTRVSDAEEADIVLSFVPEVRDCGAVTDAAGCAPRPTSPESISRPASVRVRTGLSNASTVTVLKHELGHALGLGHEDEPQPLMAPIAKLTTLPQRDATERVLPWRDPELSVYVEFGNHSDPGAVRSQVGHALEYYDRGAGGTVPENVSLTLTRDRSAADVVVRFRDRACGQVRGSCARRSGVDPDGDGALEYFTSVEITVAGVDAPAVGWHVAYWLGYGLGFGAEADWPPPLRDAGAEERRGEWWATG